MRELYPPIEPREVLPVADSPPHVIYVEECGNPSGIPVIFLHGGPGSGCKPYHRQFFDPRRYRIIIFDQRGCGRSTPAGETQANTTADLLADMEVIRARLRIERWVLFGGSWGATLALLYAERYPDRVLGMILRGCFLARERDIDWFFKEGINRLFPDFWEETMRAFTSAEQEDLIAASYRRMQSKDGALRLATAVAWTNWTGRVTTYLLSESGPAAASEEQQARMINDVNIETHYALHRYFLRPDQVMRDLARLPIVPTTLIHGRRDLTCLLESSWGLHQGIAGSKLVIVRAAGHLASEPAMIDALVTATDEMAEKLA